MKNLKIFTRTMLFIFLLASLFSASAANAQQKPAQGEINFITKDFTASLANAKAKHKMIFVDAYAKWCAPCKELQRTTFRDAEAAAYFNRNFINVAVDVEKGEGISLARKWKIEGLPTLLILDESGTVIASHIGYVDGKGLLEFAHEVSQQ